MQKSISVILEKKYANWTEYFESNQNHAAHKSESCRTQLFWPQIFYAFYTFKLRVFHPYSEFIVGMLWEYAIYTSNWCWMNQVAAKVLRDFNTDAKLIITFLRNKSFSFRITIIRLYIYCYGLKVFFMSISFNFRFMKTIN